MDGKSISTNFPGSSYMIVLVQISWAMGNWLENRENVIKKCVNKIADNKYFWKTVKRNFTEKRLKDEKIVLVKSDTS